MYFNCDTHAEKRTSRIFKHVSKVSGMLMAYVCKDRRHLQTVVVLIKTSVKKMIADDGNEVLTSLGALRCPRRNEGTSF